MSKSADENLFLIAAAAGVAVIAYLAFSNKSLASPAAGSPAAGSPAAPASAVNADMGGEDFGVNDPSTW